jgi:hypothetical protein
MASRSYSVWSSSYLVATGRRVICEDREARESSLNKMGVVVMEMCVMESMSRRGYTRMCMCIYNGTSGVQRNNTRVVLSSQHSAAAVGENGWRSRPRALDAY